MLMRKRSLALALVCQTVVTCACAANIEDVPCSVIVGVWDAVRAIVPALIAIMFMYGAAKYVYSAEEPGGRQQGKTICIHAIIGGIIMGLIAAVVSAIGMTGRICPGMTGFT